MTMATAGFDPFPARGGGGGRTVAVNPVRAAGCFGQGRTPATRLVIEAKSMDLFGAAAFPFAALTFGLLVHRTAALAFGLLGLGAAAFAFAALGFHLLVHGAAALSFGTFAVRICDHIATG